MKAPVLAVLAGLTILVMGDPMDLTTAYEEKQTVFQNIVLYEEGAYVCV